MGYRTGLAVRCFALGVLALLVLPPAWAEDPGAEYEAIKRASLKGVESLEVIVPPPNMDAACRPVAPEDLQAEVEARLDDGGIRFGPSADTHLIIAVTGFEPVKDLLCGFSMTVALQQVVLLVRDPRIMTFGVTWEHAGLGVATPARVADHLRHMLAHMVEEFIAIYRDQNPKQ
jgi:hypothetical protein